MPRSLFHFLYPGIRLKRWMFLLIMGIVVMIAGITGVLGEALSARTFHIKPLQKVEKVVRTYVRSLRPMDLWLIVGGGVAVLFAVRRGYYAILAVIMPSGERRFIRLAYERARRKRGPKIVAIGGGTGLPNLLLGLKEYTDNLTAVVTVADDGGSSGRLRRQYGIPPPGDLRNCLVALADAEPLMGRLFQHRFARTGELKGHTFGNIFLTALAEVSGDFSRALAESSRVLAVRGRVVPVTLDLVQLVARLKNGRTVRGESRIASAGSPVDRVQILPARPRANPDALKAIGRADIIVFGPGSLFTSVVPNLLVPEIRAAINGTRALKIYACNIMTEPGETDDFTVADHLETIARYLGTGGMDAVVVNTEPPPARLLERYRREHAGLVTVDTDRLKAMGVRVISGRVLAARADYIRHDSAKLSATIMKYAVI
jgi:uncharacterized cofD-like protein